MAYRSPLRFVVFLLLMAAVFGYIAWKWQEFNRQTASLDQGEPLVVGEDGLAADEAAEPSVPAAGGQVVDGTGGFFAESRVERDRARSQRLEILKAMINNPNVSADARTRAEQELLTLSRRMAQEAEIENLLRARGFEDVLVYLYAQSAIVVVGAKQLTEAQVAQIADAVARVAGIPFEGISVLAKPGRG